MWHWTARHAVEKKPASVPEFVGLNKASGTFRDHANKVYYWKTYNDPSLRAVDLKELDFSAGQPTRTLSIASAKPKVQMATPKDFSTATQ